MNSTIGVILSSTKLVMNIRRLGEILLHFIFPVSCPVCGKIGSSLCPECRQYMHDADTTHAASPSQKIPSLFAGEVIIRETNGLKIYSSLSYNASARKIINGLKKTGDRNYWRVLGHHMAEMFGECEADVLIPVPLHLYSKKKHNHSRELAEGMCEVWNNVRIIDAALWTREVWSSQDITHEDFRLTKVIEGMRVALVDDYCVSGRTLSCLAETCRHEEAYVICAYTLAGKTSQPEEAHSSPDILANLSAERYESLARFFTGEIITRQIASLTVYSAAEYHESGIREEIHKFKYGGAINLCAYFGKHMAEKFGECRADYLVPVPLHLNSDRGYNQTLELAKGMCELWKDVKILDAGVWTRGVPRRAVSKERPEITPSDFGITQDISGKRIALIDDVCTTGTTLWCFSEACRKSGAIVVCAYALASA